MHAVVVRPVIHVGYLFSFSIDFLLLKIQFPLYKLIANPFIQDMEKKVVPEICKFFFYGNKTMNNSYCNKRLDDYLLELIFRMGLSTQLKAIII